MSPFAPPFERASAPPRLSRHTLALPSAPHPDSRRLAPPGVPRRGDGFCPCWQTKMLQDGDHRRGLGHIAAGSSAALRTGTGARPAKYTRRISDAQSMRAKGGGTTPVPRLLRGRASLPAPDGSDAAPSLDGSRSAAALVPFAPFRFLAFRAGARVPSAPARASPGTRVRAPGRIRREHPGKSQERISRWGHQRRHPRQEMHRRHHQVGRAVSARLAKLVRHPAIREHGEPLEAEARPRAVPAQA